MFLIILTNYLQGILNKERSKKKIFKSNNCIKKTNVANFETAKKLNPKSINNRIIGSAFADKSIKQGIKNVSNLCVP